jgi:Fis family transcriptional regulator
MNQLNTILLSADESFVGAQRKLATQQEQLASLTDNIEKYSMSKDSIQEAVHKNLEKYFRDLGEQQASNIYDMVVLAVEKPMLELIMTRTDSNQSQAADMLGINRNTLRKKLQQHGLL